LWLYGPDHTITEVGAMNIFVLLQHKNGKKELVTPPLEGGIILPGITRYASSFERLLGYLLKYFQDVIFVGLWQLKQSLLRPFPISLLLVLELLLWGQIYFSLFMHFSISEMFVTLK
jgi:hypothetical protein